MWSQKASINSQSGNAFVFAILFFLLLIGGLAFYFFSAQSTSPTPSKSNLPTESTSTQLDEALEQQTSESSLSPKDAAQELTEFNPKQFIPFMNFQGTVIDKATGLPIEDAIIKWAPLSLLQVSKLMNDHRILGEANGKLEGLNSEVMQAMQKSTSTKSNEDGTFKLRVEKASTIGVVFAWKKGYQAQRVKYPSNPKEDLRIQLEAGAAISGRVLDHAGEAAVGMQIIAITAPDDDKLRFTLLNYENKTAGVGKDGYYSICSLPPGRYSIVPYNAETNFVSFIAEEGQLINLQAGDDLQDVDFKVARGGIIRGSLTNSKGETISEANCSLTQADLIRSTMAGNVKELQRMQSFRCTSDGNGKFEFKGVPLGQSYRVQVLAKEYAPSQSSVAELSIEQPEAELQVKLSEGYSISGHVFYENGDPATVKIQFLPDLSKIMSGNTLETLLMQNNTLSSEDGSFELKHILEGEYTLVAGDIRPEQMFTLGEDSFSKVTVEVLDSDLTGVEISIANQSGEEVSGLVMDDLGNPLPGAKILLVSGQYYPGVQGKTAIADASGQFSLEADGGPFTVRASLTDFSSATLNQISADSEELQITLNRHATVSGKVTLSSREEIPAGSTIDAKLIGEENTFAVLERMINRQGNTAPRIEADGSFEFLAPSGNIQITAKVAGFAPTHSESIAVNPGSEITDIELHVTKGASINGKVVFNGRAVAGAKVSAQSKEDANNLYAQYAPQFFSNSINATTDEKGYYSILHLAPGEYIVQAEHKDFAPSSKVDVIVELDKDLDIAALKMREGGSIVGSVIENDQAKAGIMVQLLGNGPMKMETTDAEGRFEFDMLKPGSYMLTFSDMTAMQQGKLKVKTRVVDIKETEEHKLEVIFGKGFKISGKITDLPPSPMRVISLRKPGGPLPEEIDMTNMQEMTSATKYQAGMAFVDAEGNYVIEDIEPGTYFLEIVRMPDNPNDLSAYAKMKDRSPHFRKEVKIDGKDLEIDIKIK